MSATIEATRPTMAQAREIVEGESRRLLAENAELRDNLSALRRENSEAHAQLRRQRTMAQAGSDLAMIHKLANELLENLAGLETLPGCSADISEVVVRLKAIQAAAAKGRVFKVA